MGYPQAVTKATLNNQAWLNVDHILQLYLKDTHKPQRPHSKWVKGQMIDLRQHAHPGWPLVIIADPSEDTEIYPIARELEVITLIFPITVFASNNSDLKQIADDIRNILKTNESSFETWKMRNLAMDMGTSATAEFGSKIILIKEITVSFQFSG